MRKKILATLSALAIGLGMVAFSATAADATVPTVVGSATCNPITGKSDITWKVGGDTDPRYSSFTATIMYQSAATTPTLMGESVTGAETVSGIQSGLDAGTYTLTVKVQWTNHSDGDLVKKKSEPVTVSGNCVVADAVATVSTPGPTCDTPQSLVLDTPTNATWNKNQPVLDAEGPGSFSATATANDHHTFANGKTTFTITGTLLAASGDCAPQLAVAIYIYPLVDASKSPSWNNSGSQTLIAHRLANSTSDWYSALPTLPAYVCGAGWGVQQDIGKLSSTFTENSFPSVVDRRSNTGVLGWPPIVAAIHQPLSALVDSIPDCAPPSKPSVTNASDTCNQSNGRSATTPGTITFATGEWKWFDASHNEVSGTVNYAADDYTFTAEANSGYKFDDQGTTSMPFSVKVGTTKATGPCLTLLTPVEPVVNSHDVCGTVPDTLTLGSTQDHVTYVVTWNSEHSDATVTASVTDSTKYAFKDNAQTVWKFQFTNEDCPVIFVQPTAVNEVCSGVGDGLVDGNIGVDLSGNLANEISYQIKGGTYDFTANQATNILPPGDYTVTATAKSGYTLDPSMDSSWQLTILHAIKCTLMTSPLISTTATSTNLTCASTGTYTLPNTEGVVWYTVVNGVNTVTQPGTHTVSKASTVKIHAEVLNSDYGWEDGAQTDWTFNFTNPTECLLTLAFTGSTGSNAGLLFAGGFLLIGGTIIAFERRFRTTAK